MTDEPYDMSSSSFNGELEKFIPVQSTAEKYSWVGNTRITGLGNIETNDSITEIPTRVTWVKNSSELTIEVTYDGDTSGTATVTVYRGEDRINGEQIQSFRNLTYEPLISKIEELMRKHS